MWTSETRKRLDRLIGEMNDVVDSGNTNFKKIKKQIETLEAVKDNHKEMEEKISNLSDQVESLESMMEQILLRIDVSEPNKPNRQDGASHRKPKH